MRKIIFIIMPAVLPLLSIFLISQYTLAATYYVRTDGGTAAQCTGLEDAAYPGSGEHQPCAWSHPFWALNSSEPPTWKIQSGDSLIIHQGSYRMGYGAPNTGWCDQDYPWGCHLPAIPSGLDATHPTILSGSTKSIKGFHNDADSTREKEEKPELWGAERPWQIISLEGTSNAVIEYLEITDHSGCIEFHADPEVACERDNYPFGDWASDGIYAADSNNVTLKDLNIHGLAGNGMRAGRISNWSVENVRIAGNGGAGWEGDLGENSSNSGTLSFKNWTVEWNGCAETYPEQEPAHCWAQPVGGYGDGVGTGITGGHWIIEDSTFRYNTSDGLDLLYLREENTQVEIKRSKAYGNAGNQIKVNGPSHIENSLLVGNCGFFYGKPFAPEIDGIDPIDHCRAGGSSLALNLLHSAHVSVVNSTIVGQGDCLVEAGCDWDYSNCDGSESVTVLNNIFRGYEDFNQPGDQTCYIWFDEDNFYTTLMNYNVIYDTKIGEEIPIGDQDIFTDPKFTNSDLENFDGHLLSDSSALDNGLPVGSYNLIPDHDLELVSRPQGAGVDRGAYEYKIANSPPYPPTLLLPLDGSMVNAEAVTFSWINNGDPDGDLVGSWLYAVGPWGQVISLEMGADGFQVNTEINYIISLFPNQIWYWSIYIYDPNFNSDPHYNFAQPFWSFMTEDIK